MPAVSLRQRHTRLPLSFFSLGFFLTQRSFQKDLSPSPARSNSPLQAVRRRSASPVEKQVVEQETVGRRRRFSRVWILIPPRGIFGNVSIRRLKILLGLPGEKRTRREKRERNPDGRQNDDGFLFATPRSGSEPSRLCAHIMKARHKRFIRSGQPRYEIRRFAEKEHSRLVRFGFSTPMS